SLAAEMPFDQGELLGAAHEGWTGQGPARRRSHAWGRCGLLTGRFEQGALSGREAEGFGEEGHGVPAWGTTGSPLKGADPLDAQPGAVGQLLLGQASCQAVAFEQLTEPQRSRRGHVSSSPVTYLPNW